MKQGSRFGRWTVIGFGEREYSWGVRKHALCRCECGTERLVTPGDLKRGKSSSCGCYRVEASRASATTHGMANTRLDRVFRAIKSRCSNDSDPVYGGRGVAVCDEWMADPQAFFDWADRAGYQPGLLIDRIDNDKGYSPDNCRWVTPGASARNRRACVQLTAFGETKVMSEWARDARCAVPYGTLKSRIRRGWAHQRAITEPPSSTLFLPAEAYA